MLTDKQLRGLSLLLGVPKDAANLYYQARTAQKAGAKGLIVESFSHDKEWRKNAKRLLKHGWLVHNGSTTRKNRPNSVIYTATALPFEGKALDVMGLLKTEG
jgi:hypothetical protein